MRKLLSYILLVAICLAITVSCMASSVLPDISGLSIDDLSELRNLINLRLIELNDNGETVFDDQGIMVKWLGFNADYYPRIKNSLLITNKTEKPLYYEITKIAYNGIQISASNSFRSDAIEPEMSYLTATNNLNMVDISLLESFGIKKEDDFKDVFLEMSFFHSDSYGENAIATCKLHIPIE